MNDQTEQLRTNVSNRLNGSYPAQIINTTHPRGLYMASIRLLGYWDMIPDEDLPFAEFLLPIGAKAGNGEVAPVEPGDYVWVDFPRMGDTRFPRITGSLYYAPNYESNLPPEVNGEAFNPRRAEGEPTPPNYDRKDALYDRFGLRELRTHTGGWSVTHKETGTTVEITPNGGLVLHVEGNSFRSSTGNTLEQVKGSLTIKVDGDANFELGGRANIKGATVNIESDGAVSVSAGGAFIVKATNADFQLG